MVFFFYFAIFTNISTNFRLFFPKKRNFSYKFKFFNVKKKFLTKNYKIGVYGIFFFNFKNRTTTFFDFPKNNRKNMRKNITIKKKSSFSDFSNINFFRDIAVQLLFIPFFQSKSIMHNLGVSIIVNEWAALYRSGITAKTLEKPPPLTIIQLADGIVRGPGKQYDEMTTIVMGLTKDCNEFIEYCVVRGFDRTSAEARGESPEDVSKAAYSIVRPNLKTEKQRESIDSRYNTLCRSIENAKMNIKSNGM